MLELPAVDAGGDWLIFALPPADLMCDDIEATLAGLAAKGVGTAREVTSQGWGLLAAIRLPDGSELPIYQPRHPTPSRD